MNRSGITRGAKLAGQQSQTRVGLAPTKGYRVGRIIGVQQPVGIELPIGRAEGVDGLQLGKGDAEHACAHT